MHRPGIRCIGDKKAYLSSVFYPHLYEMRSLFYNPSVHLQCSSSPIGSHVSGYKIDFGTVSLGYIAYCISHKTDAPYS
jgi:hypothetical protein